METKRILIIMQNAYAEYVDVIVEYCNMDSEFVVLSVEEPLQRERYTAFTMDQLTSYAQIPFDYVIVMNDLFDKTASLIEHVLSEKNYELCDFNRAYDELLNSSGKMEFLRRKIQNTYPRPESPLIEVGDFSYFNGMNLMSEVNDGSVKVRIGKFCSIAPEFCIMLGMEHHLTWMTTYPFGEMMPGNRNIKKGAFSKGDIVIGNDVWIGKGVTILSGITIGDGAVIGAGAVVSKSVDPYQIVAGNPARVMKKRFSDDTIKRLSEMQWWNWEYEMLYEAIPLLQSENIDGLYSLWQNGK